MDNKRFLWYLSAALLLYSMASCDRLLDRPPVDRQKMAAILQDMSIANEYAKGLNPPTDSFYGPFDLNKDTLAVFYKSILQHYDIEKEDFNKAVNWYLQHPSMYDSVMLKTVAQLEKMQDKAPIAPKVVAPPSEKGTK